MDGRDFSTLEALVETTRRSRVESGSLFEVTEVSRVVRTRYPDAVMVRVAVDDGDEVWCMAVGIYGPGRVRLALENYAGYRYPYQPRMCQSQVEQAWIAGGWDAWPQVEGQDTADYPLEDVREVWFLPDTR